MKAYHEKHKKEKTERINTKTYQAECSGSLQCSIEGLWTYICPTCRRTIKSKTKCMAMVCRTCNPQGPQKTTKNTYWPLELDQVIDQYNKTENQEERNKIYEEKLAKPFAKLVECIYNTFKFTYFNVGPLEIQKECIGHLVAQINKYDASLGTKSFSYFSIIAKNWLIALNNSVYKDFNRNESINMTGADHDYGKKDEYTIELQMEDPYYEKEELKQYIQLFIEFWDQNVDRIFPKERDKNIAMAIIEIIRQSDRVDFYNKKALYLMIREICGCRTQWITKVSAKMNLYNRRIRDQWINHGNININERKNIISSNLPEVS